MVIGYGVASLVFMVRKADTCQACLLARREQNEDARINEIEMWRGRRPA